MCVCADFLFLVCVCADQYIWLLIFFSWYVYVLTSISDCWFSFPGMCMCWPVYLIADFLFLVCVCADQYIWLLIFFSWHIYIYIYIPVKYCKLLANTNQFHFRSKLQQIFLIQVLAFFSAEERFLYIVHFTPVGLHLSSSHCHSWLRHRSKKQLSANNFSMMLKWQQVCNRELKLYETFLL